MPIYEYVYVSCSFKFDKLQAMADSGADCERCGQPSKRVISLFSSLTAGEDGKLSSIADMGGCPACAGGSCGCSV